MQVFFFLPAGVYIVKISLIIFNSLKTLLFLVISVISAIIICMIMSYQISSENCSSSTNVFHYSHTHVKSSQIGKDMKENKF